MAREAWGPGKSKWIAMKKSRYSDRTVTTVRKVFSII